MKKLSEKQFLVLVGVPACAVILFFLYYMIFGSQNENKRVIENNNNSSVILPEVSSNTEYKAKTTIYEELEDKESQDKMNKKMMKDESFFNINDQEIIEGDNKKKIVEFESNHAPVKNPAVNQKNVSNTKSIHPIIKGEKMPLVQYQDKKETQLKEQSITDNSNDNGFGVYQGKNVNSNTNKEENKAFIPAFLDEGKKIKDGSEVVFILQKGSTINGIYFEKMSIMYGMASFNGNRIQIIINTIQDKKGGKHQVSLVGYNENYQKGIYYEDKLDKAVDQSKSSVASQTGSQIGQATGGRSGNLISSTINAGSRLLTRERGEISIAQGYKMFFK